MAKFIFDFKNGSAAQKDLLGGKGANLAEMTRLKFPVPPGFTISTKMCLKFLRDRKFDENFLSELDDAVKNLEKQTGKKFGCDKNPLLVSVRSGARISMPGMMDTVLNLGLNDATVETLAAKTGNGRFAFDSYRRFLQMFGDVVLGIEFENFENEIKIKKSEMNLQNDTDLSEENWREICEKFKKIIAEKTGENFPQNPRAQLEKAIVAVFESWEIPRAKKYREIHKIPHDLGTAVNIQTMVFGNLSNHSATGVCFSRSPISGKKNLFGDFLINAQGEDVVAGIRTPREIAELENAMPEAFAELKSTAEKLEKHFREMQDLEFTIENGKFFMLQTRTGKRTAAAAVKIAVDFVAENLISKNEAILRIDANSLNQLLHQTLDPNSDKKIIATGIAASPGAACGKIYFTADDAIAASENGEKVILVRHETSPEDIGGMHVSEGILTACGGKASHAAVVARGMGTPCVAGATEIIVNSKAKKFTVGETVVSEGEILTLNGTTGEIILGICKTVEPKISDEFAEILKWADETRKLQIRANADTPADAAKSREFGAEGIGLCRTEHMFFDDERISIVREMIFANSTHHREKSLAKLLPMQKKDFEEIFEKMDGLPVTIRLLDPPLHEFLPQKNSDIEKLAENFGITFEAAKDRVKNLHEVNPMLGHRGVRLSITFPEILKMQARAILLAAIAAQKTGAKVLPEIMVPLVGNSTEFEFCKKEIETVAKEIFSHENFSVDFKIGTMIELPRACCVANEIAESADFFSFGTNDLTQMSFGFSRDDAGRFLPEYLQKNVLRDDPFEIFDAGGTGKLVKFAVENSRKIKPNLKISVCGEHGGDPESIEFFAGENFTTVSCSPFRVPIARLAAAQAVLKLENKNSGAGEKCGFFARIFG
jgi:pyruvate,orthophosphate dikinase